MGFIDARNVIGLLRWVASLGAFVTDWNHNLRCVWIPFVIMGGRRVARNVSVVVNPRQASPSATWAPVFTLVSATLCATVVDGRVELDEAT